MSEHSGSKVSRRTFVKLTGAAGGTLVVASSIVGSLGRPAWARSSGGALPGGTLDPTTIPKFVSPMVIPLAMPRTGSSPLARGVNADYYEIAVRQFGQQILPPGLPQTKVWSYGSVNHPSSFNYPAFTIEARWHKPLRIKWANGLVDASGNYLPHLLPVDQTLHWANPPGGTIGRDMPGGDPAPYRGPVPIVTHLHGAHITDESDGYAEAWYLPNARDIPSGYAAHGTWYPTFREKFREKNGVIWQAGTATFQYANDQPAATLWYHDHALGITRLNVYAGMAGFYLLRGGPFDREDEMLPRPAPRRGAPQGQHYFEIPIVIQDRSFNADGSLFYPDTRAFFDGFGGPYAPASDVPPMWNPEFFGNTIVVNGRTWPFFKIEPRRYRLRFLNGCNSRFLILKMVTGDPRQRPTAAALPFWQIGSDGGFLSRPVQRTQMLLAPAERADVIVDFTDFPGVQIFLINEGPDEPFGGGIAGTDFPFAHTSTTGTVMKFVVSRPLSGEDTSLHPASQNFTLPAPPGLGAADAVRRVALLEEDSQLLQGVGPVAALLGTVKVGSGKVRRWDDPISENLAQGATEIWEIYNFTEDAHPIHVHQVQFRVIGRRHFGAKARRPNSWESGPKDTVVAYPREITRIKARFDLPGRYVWHCHILEHEDNQMMRPYNVGPDQRPGF